jgi:hypothetical protein
MDIKNKNIFLNLNDGEEIIYVAEKNKGEFIYLTLLSILPIILLFICVILFIIAKYYSFYSLFGTLIFVFMLYSTYTNIRDYFFTEIILTNQRLIISKFNRLTFIDYSEIDSIISLMNRARVYPMLLRLKSKKKYVIFFVNIQKLKDKLVGIYPSYDETKTIQQDEKELNISLAVLVFLPIIIFIIYLFSHIKA